MSNYHQNMKSIDEFKKFALKGNVLDMAIGIMIGTAFNRIVTSLVEDIMMPPLGLFLGGLSFSEYKMILRPEVRDAANKVIATSVSVNYGQFIQVLINFLIIALSMFVAVKLTTYLRTPRDKHEDKAVAVAPAQDIAILTEIRDLLAKKQK